MKLNLVQRLQVQEFVVCIRFVLESGWALSVATRSLLSGDPLYYDKRNAHNHEDETQCHKCNRLENITQSEKKKNPQICESELTFCLILTWIFGRDFNGSCSSGMMQM